MLFSYAACVVVNELGINWLERLYSRILKRTFYIEFDRAVDYSAQLRLDCGVMPADFG